MDLKRLRTFVVVAEQGTVSGAAETLRITQPALSRQLQDLQAEFGVPLFDQVGRRLRLTAEGAELVSTCRALLTQADNVLEHARSLAQGDRGELSVGATPHTIASVFPRFLRQFATSYPRVRVRTVEAGAVDQLELLRRGDLHAAVGLLEGTEAEFVAYPPASGQTSDSLQSRLRPLVRDDSGSPRASRCALASSCAGIWHAEVVRRGVPSRTSGPQYFHGKHGAGDASGSRA
jgi:DNA-binding transcriptional LysR family regulator